MVTSNELDGRRSIADVALVAAGGVGAGMVAAYWGIGGVASRRVRPFASSWVVSQVPTRRPAVALTFDDGPDPEFTARITEALGAARATFFVLGARTRAWPSLVRETFAAGHEIASHGDDHTHLWTLSPRATLRDLHAGHRAVCDAIGQPPTAYRPPHGLFNLAAWVGAPRLGMRRTLWSLSSRDFADGMTAEAVAARVLDGVRPGSVVLMHDSADGEDRPARTLAALPVVLEGLRARGLEPVTLGELLSGAGAR